MARAGNNLSDDDPGRRVPVHPDGGSDNPARSLIVIVPSGSAAAVRVNIPSLHGSAYVEIPAGLAIGSPTRRTAPPTVGVWTG